MAIQDLNDVETYFLSRARQMWGDTINKISFSFEVNERPIEIASLRYSNKPYAIGNTLVTAPSSMILAVKPKFFNMNFENQIKILIHEAGHIGYPNHNDAFKKIVESNGGVVSINQLEGGGYHVEGQKAKGQRFSLIKKFKDRDEAHQFAYTLNTERKYYRIRISY